jgi:antitoxin component YwqK of YwqJK toxin-antitoxin module
VFDAATGRLRQQHTFVNGALQGGAASWQADGSPESRGTFAGGQRDGAWSFWRADGSVDAERTGWYRAGVREQ